MSVEILNLTEARNALEAEIKTIDRLTKGVSTYEDLLERMEERKRYAQRDLAWVKSQLKEKLEQA